MDKEFLQKMGIQDAVPSNDLINRLEEKQLEYLERIENATDNKRKIELHQDLQKIEKSIEEVKHSISAVSMGIALDDSNDTQEIKIQEVQSPEADKKAEQKAKIKQEVEVLKQKSAVDTEQTATDSLEQPEAANAQPQITNAQPTTNMNTSSPDQNTDADSSNNTELSKGLKAYKSGDYKKAFKIFKGLSEAKNPEAQFLLARMYDKGEGTILDKERSKFWYKTSAESGHADSQYAYALLLKDDNAAFKDILTCLEKACEQKHKKALGLYIDTLVQAEQYNTNYLSKASRYCDLLIEMEKDSYVIANYEKTKRKIARYKIYCRTFNWGKLLQNIVLLVGMFYAYMGSRLTETFGIPVIKAPVITIKWEFLHELLNHFFTSNGIFGLLLLLIGSFLDGIIDKYTTKRTIYNVVIGRITTYLVFGVPIWQFIRIFQASISWKTQIGWIVITWGIMIIGNAVGEKIPKINIKKLQ